MKTFKMSSGWAAVVAVSLSTTVLRADMGAVWVTGVTGNSVTIDWSDPDDTHGLATGIPLYRVSWAPVDAGEQVLANNAEVLVGASQKPHTFSGLSPGSYYRFRVETHATVMLPSGESVNAKYRQVATIRQGTATLEAGPGLRLAGANQESLQVEFTNPDPGAFKVIRIAYKARWKVEDLCAIASDPLGPRTAWVSPQQSAGWVDVNSSSVIRESLPRSQSSFPMTLLKDTSYEIVAYGFNIGDTVGTRLGNVQGKTSGASRFEGMARAISSDHPEILSTYKGRLLTAHANTPVIDLVGEEHPSIYSAKPALLMDLDDLDDDFTALHYVIDGDPETFASWQEKEEEKAEGVRLVDFVARELPDLRASLEREVGEPVFQRGDASPDGYLDISDTIRILAFLFDASLGAEISCKDAADANDSGDIDLSDPVYILNFLFMSGPTPPAPHGTCGPDGPGDDLDCEFYASCPGPVPSR